MPRPPPPAPRRRISPYRIRDYRYDADASERCKEPIAQRRRVGNKTRVIISSAQDGYQTTNADYIPIERATTRINLSNRRADYADHDYRRSRSRSSSRNHRRRRSSSHAELRYEAPYSRHSRRGSSESGGPSDAEELSTLEFEFDLPESVTSGDSHSTTAILESSLDPRHGSGSAPIAGLTTDLHLVGSRWLGNTLDYWDLSVELKTAPVSPHLRPLMIWHHMERAMPTFDEFIAVVRRELQQAPEKNLRRVEKMLRKIQKENEKQRQRGREMVPICMSDAEYRNDGNDDKQNFSASFAAYPFFSLERLAENRSSTPNAAHHPSRPLLQTYTRTVNDKRELSQVITTRSSTPKGQALHISSVWCLIVNNMIITCSSLSLDELRKDFSSIPNEPHSSSARTVCVKAGNTRSWSFSTDELTSWPSLLATFANDLSAIGDKDASAKFTHHGRIVSAETWSQILASSTRFPIELVLEDGNDDSDSGLRSKLRAVKDAFAPKKVFPMSQPAPSTVNVASPDGSASLTAAATNQVVNHLRNIPALHMIHRDSNGSKTPFSQLADSLHEKLATHPQKVAASAYQSCPEASLTDVQSKLSQDTISSRMNTSRAPATVADGKLGQIAILGEYVFAFYWPIDCDHVMTRRFWGALHQILESEIMGSTNPRRDAETAADFYHVLYNRVFAIISALTTNLLGSDTPPASFPSQFYEAWLHILSAFVLLSESRRKDTRFHASWLPTEQLRTAATKLEAGELELVSNLRTTDAEDHEVCSSKGITALMLNRLSQDVIHEGPDVVQTYGDFCQQLDAKILENPLTRAHQATIRDLQQELEAVLSVLTQQLDVVNVFERSIQAQDEDRRMPYLPLLLDSRQDAVLATCKNTLAARVDRIKALQARAAELGEWHLGEIANNKDRQESAIMVFTIVTIIFLPLSFVSSVFGMNTSDIRDMEFKQWLYWVVAVPLTIFVIAGSLYWAGALSDWQIGSSSGGQSAYRPLAAEQSMRAAVTRRGMIDEIDVEKPRRRTTYPARDVERHYV